MSLGQRLREERGVLQLTQVVLAEACGVKKLAQIRFETDAQLPGGAYLVAAARQGVDVKYVLTGHRGIERVALRLDPTLLAECEDAVDGYLLYSKKKASPRERFAMIAKAYDRFCGAPEPRDVREYLQRRA